MGTGEAGLSPGHVAKGVSHGRPTTHTMPKDNNDKNGVIRLLGIH